jgi:phosphate-selective porin OprO/OprP
MKLKRTLMIAGLVSGLAATTTAKADDDTAETIKALKQQIEALDQKVRVLERNRELDQVAAGEAAKATPRITLGGSGFTISSADTNFAVALHGVLQVDSRTFENNNHVAGIDTILLRRARPILSGTVFRDYDFLFVPDFGGGTPGAVGTPTVFDAYLNYRYSPELQLQAGKFKTPTGLEQLQADVNTSFNERSLVTDLVPNRDLGFAVHGDLWGGVLSYTAGIFNGVGDARNSNNTDFDNSREFDGRLFVLPFKGTKLTALQNFGIGVAGGYGTMSVTNTIGLPNTTGGTAPGYATDGQQQFFAYTNNVFATGTHWRLSPQAYYYYGPLSLLGEYAISDQQVRRTVGANVFSADLQNTAWEITGGWVLTGEDASFAGVTPRRPFDPRNGAWGAWQLVARYAELNIDQAAFPVFSNPGTSASAAQAWSLGLNWYLNRNVRLNASYSHTTFTGGGGTGTSAPSSVTQHPENVFFTRIQLGF